MEEVQIPGLDASFGAFQTRIQRVLEHDKIGSGSRGAIGAALEDLRADLHEIAVQRGSDAVQRAALLRGLASICRRYEDILPPSARPAFPQASPGPAPGAESPPDGDPAADQDAHDSSARALPPLTLEGQVRELAREVRQLEMERDAVLDLLSEQAGVPSPCGSQAHSPRIAAHRPEAEDGEDSYVGHADDAQEEADASDAHTPMVTPQRDPPALGMPSLEQTLAEAQGKIAALQTEVLRLQGLLEAAAAPPASSGPLPRHPRPGSLLTRLAGWVDRVLAKAGSALDTLLLLACSLIHAAGLRQLAMLLSVGLGGVLQLAWILAGVAAWPSHVEPSPAWH